MIGGIMQVWNLNNAQVQAGWGDSNRRKRAKEKDDGNRIDCG